MTAPRKNHGHAFGQGDKPVVFAHGYGCDQNMWRLINPEFEHDYRIILFDFKAMS